MTQTKAQLVDTSAENINYTGPGNGSVARTALNKLSDFVSVLDYGADPTGVSESRNAIQLALNAAAATGVGVVIVPPGSYRCSSGNLILIPSNTSVISTGAVLDFSGNPQESAGRVRAQGSVISTVALTSNAFFNTSTLTVASTSGLQRGQVVMLQSNATVPESADTIGEWVTVRDVVSSTQVTLVGTVQDSYLVTDSASIEIVNFAENIFIEGLSILGKGTPGTGASSNEAGFLFLRAKNFKLERCRVSKCDYQAIIVDTCYEWEISNCETFQEEDNVPGEIIQYGITMKNAASNGVVRGNNCFGGRHGIVWTSNQNPGISRNVIIRDNFIQGTYAGAISTHQDTSDVSIISNYIEGCGRATDIRVRKVRILNNVVKNQDPNNIRGDGIFLSVWPGEIVIQGNVVETGRFAIRMYDLGLNSAFAPYDVLINGNTFKGLSQIGVLLEQKDNNTDKPGFVITNNAFEDCTGDCLRLNGKFTGPVVSNNFFRSDGSGFAVRLMGTEKAQIIGNTFINFANPVRLENSGQTPAAPSINPIIANNVWEGGAGALISGSGTNVSNVNNIKHV